MEPIRSRTWSRYRAICLAYPRLCVDTSTGAVVFIYGWIRSTIAWPFIIPSIGYTVADVGTLVAYLVFGPLRVNTSPLWQPVGPVQGLQSLACALLSAFMPIAKVRANIFSVATFSVASTHSNIAVGTCHSHMLPSLHTSSDV